MKRAFVTILSALALGLLPVWAAAAEAPADDAAAAEGILEEDALPAGSGSTVIDRPDLQIAYPGDSDNPGSGFDTDPNEPDGPDEPGESYVPISPGLEKSAHPVYLRGSNDLFRPEANVTRAETACMIYSLLESERAPIGEASFTDVSPAAWYGPQVLALTEMGALNGYEDGTFQPNRTITRGEFIGIISRFFTPWAGAPQTFTDVKEGVWFWQEINAAAERGWINGYSDGTFRPNQKISRAEAAAILNRVLDRAGSKAKQKLDADGKVMLFLDLPLTHWAYYDIMEASLEHTHSADGGWSGYTVPAASRAPGYHSIGGELYHIDENGHWTRNKTIGVLKFDDSGKYTTGNAELDRKLTEIVRANTAEGDTPRAVFQRLHKKFTTECRYQPGSYLKDGETGWEARFALEMIDRKMGNCYRFAALETMIARKLGFQARGVSGFIDRGYGFVYHGWTEIDLNGVTYHCDLQQQNAQLFNSLPKWNAFMRTYKEVYSVARYRVLGKVMK